MDFNRGDYRYHVIFTDTEKIIVEVFTAMSVMLNLGCMMAVIMLPQYPEEVLEVAVLDIDENVVLPMRNGDILVNEREWFLQGRFMYPEEYEFPQQEEQDEPMEQDDIARNDADLNEDNM